MFTRLLAAAKRLLNRLLSTVTEAATEGVMPEQNFYAAEANVEWMRRWALMAMDTLLRGGRVSVTPVDGTMFVIAIASLMVARKMKATSTTV